MSSTIWTTRNGTQIAVRDMQLSHLFNLLACLERWWENFTEETFEVRHRREHTIRREWLFFWRRKISIEIQRRCMSVPA